MKGGRRGSNIRPRLLLRSLGSESGPTIFVLRESKEMQIRRQRMSTLPSPQWALLDQVCGAYFLTGATIILSNAIAHPSHSRSEFEQSFSPNIRLFEAPLTLAPELPTVGTR